MHLKSLWKLTKMEYDLLCQEIAPCLKCHVQMNQFLMECLSLENKLDQDLDWNILMQNLSFNSFYHSLFYYSFHVLQNYL